MIFTGVNSRLSGIEIICLRYVPKLSFGYESLLSMLVFTASPAIHSLEITAVETYCGFILGSNSSDASS